MKIISYAHEDDPYGDRFRQYDNVPVPAWAVDVRDDSQYIIGEFVSRINAHETERNALADHIATTARAISKHRNKPVFYAFGEPYQRSLYYDGYERVRMEDFYRENDRLRYLNGTPLIEAKFSTWIGDGCCSMSVIFPEWYLDLTEDEWKAAEEPFLDENRREDDVNTGIEREKNLAAKKAQFERLKKELGEE